MLFEVKGNIDVTDSLYQYAEEKVLNRLDRFDEYLHEVKVTVSVENEQAHKVDILIALKSQQGSRINKVSVTENDMYKSIDVASDKAFRQVTKFKDKLGSPILKEVQEFPLTDVPYSYDIGENEFNIKKIKRFDIKPMFVEEAIMQMNQLGHNFFFYYDASADKPSVVYKRKDGDYGIIESEF